MSTGITYAYSNMPITKIQDLLTTVEQAIQTSTLYRDEIERGDTETHAATVLIPEGDTDCSVTIRVDRGTMIRALKYLDLKVTWTQDLDERGQVRGT
jgi:hypothetical protein